MRYWWVNQNQTGAQEWAGGYMWSPKRNQRGRRNPFYEFMREVVPGDLILAFAQTRIPKVGVAQSFAYSCPKPTEFGTAGPNWDNVGWKVDVRWIDLGRKIRPADHMDVLSPLLPGKYAPLQADGRGLQSVYLTHVPDPLMRAIAALVGDQLQTLMRMNRLVDPEYDATGNDLFEWEEHLRREVEDASELEATEKTQIILARRGQGTFKQNVARVEHRCRVTEVDRMEYLRASHIKPWRDASNAERLDGENGLLLTPSIDHLFDRGFISFDARGCLILSPAAHELSLERMGMQRDGLLAARPFTSGQRRFLEHHRESVLLRASIDASG